MTKWSEDVLKSLLRHNSGCKLARSISWARFTELFKRANHDPCKECGFYGPKCEFLKKFDAIDKEKRASVFGLNRHKTNAQWAEELNISKRQVTKRRKEGTLK